MAQKQLLHLVLGGELSNIDDVEFKDLDRVEVVGLYPNYVSAYAAWKGKAQRTVDNAHALFHRPSAPAARSRDRCDTAAELRHQPADAADADRARTAGRGGRRPLSPQSRRHNHKSATGPWRSCARGGRSGSPVPPKAAAPDASRLPAVIGLDAVAARARASAKQRGGDAGRG
jgi:hypothetical protein